MAKRAGRKAPTSSITYDVAFSTRSIPRGLILAAACLVIAHLGLWTWHYRVGELPWLVRQLFDLDQENNLPTWFSGALLGATAALLGLRAARARIERRGWAGHWTALAVGFVLLSLDEVAGVHESINSAIVIPWAIPAAAGVAVLGTAFVPFLLALPRRTSGLFLLAAALYVGGALGVELVGNEMVGNKMRDTLQYKLATAVEESLEMAGAILFLSALLRHMAGADGAVQARVRVEDDRGGS